MIAEEHFLILYLADSKFDLKSENGEDDILYQWRLRRRLEQAQNGEPITFSSKVKLVLISNHSSFVILPNR